MTSRSLHVSMASGKAPSASTPSPIASGPSSSHSLAEGITSISEEPYGSHHSSERASTSGFSGSALNIPQQYFHSRRIRKGEVERPWLEKKDPREKWVTIIPCSAVALGIIICGLLVWQGLSTVVIHKYCPVLMEDFSNGFDNNIWTREVEVGGFGNGQFEMTTNEDENCFVKDGLLYIVPTLQDEKLIKENNVLNLTADGICTSPVLNNCVTSTNTTNGTIINPVRSARINTKKGASIRYGRVEVKAKLPAGKWLWPAIWMLPVNETYGPWPRSGEIDIAESRGNDWKYEQGGNDIISSTLHWGPDSANDAWWRTNVKHQALHTTYSDKYHTFGIEWSENYIFTYIDSRLQQVLFTKFDTKETLWDRGQFPLTSRNGTRNIDPWSTTGRQNTPFDQDFYLVLNVAVGATNGWFQNGRDEKPWVDGSRTERLDFWEKKDEWYPTWGGERPGEMVVDSVKMWQQCD